MTTWHKTLSLSLASTILFSTSLAFADEIKTNTAIMQAMDKITGRVKVIEVPVNGNVDFGTFSIVVRDCQTRPPEETPENYAFVDIVDKNIDGSKENIFRGWMMSSTPALNAVEHPIYDVWLLKCVNTEVDSAKLLSTEQLAERNSIPKKIEEEKKIKEDFDSKELETPSSEATETPAETSETEEATKETIPEEAIINEGVSESNPIVKGHTDGVFDREIIVKGLTPTEELSPQPLVIPTEMANDTPVVAPEASNSSEATVSTNDTSSTEQQPSPQQDQNSEPVEEFYDEFDSLIQE